MSDIIEIIDFHPELENHIKTLNYEWLEKFFSIEYNDRVSLENPKEEIIDKGGFIYYAKMNHDIVGSIALLKKSSDEYEIAKMAVKSSCQGRGIGKLLLEHLIQRAREKEIPKLILFTNSSLQAAIHLYEKYGFEHVNLEEGNYERADVKMMKLL